MSWAQPGSAEIERISLDEAYFRSLAIHAPVAVFSTDPAGGTRYVNPFWCELTGLNEAAALQFGWSRAVHPEDLDQVCRDWSQAVASEGRFNAEFRYLHPDGRVVWVQGSAGPLRDAEGCVVGFVGTAVDITERKRAEEALKRSEAGFRQLADVMPQIVWTASADGTPNYFNRRWYELTGEKEGGIGKESLLAALHPGDREPTRDKWNEAVRRGTPYQIQHRFLFSPAQDYRWHLSRALPERGPGGEVLCWYGTCTDIDDQKRAEECFVRLNETLVSVMESIPDVVFVTGLDGAIQFKNRAASRFALATGLADHLPAPIQAELERVLKTGEHYLPANFKTVHRFVIENEERYFLSRIVAMAAPVDEVFGAVVMLQDVTAFRLLDEVKTNLISTVSHELNTPLTSLRTALFMMSEGKADAEPSRDTELLNIARDETERLLRTLNALLDLTRYDDEVGLRVEVATPEELIQAALAQTQMAMAGARLEVKTDLEPGLPTLRVDRERILHVLTNFLTNAAKYSPQQSAIVVRAHRQNGGIRFAVADKGPGIPEEYQSRLFQKFFRVPGAPGAGAGLGLFIAHEFVQAHRGSIGVHSEPGRGSEFYFVLPWGRCSGNAEGEIMNQSGRGAPSDG